MEGLEPPTSGFGDRRSSQLSYTPSDTQPTLTLSTTPGAVRTRTRLRGRKENAPASMSRGDDKSAPCVGANDHIVQAENMERVEGNRTLVASLEGWCSTIELHPQKRNRDCRRWWRGLDSNQRRRTPADLQSAPFSHSGTPPPSQPSLTGIGRPAGNASAPLLSTTSSQVLCAGLSYRAGEAIQSL